MNDVVTTITERYLNRTRLSKAKDAQAKRYLPGGDTRTATYFFPYPSYMARGKGCYLYDVDGNQYLDFLNNYTSLIHGHAHPSVVEAARAQLELGVVYGSAAAIQFELAEMICERIPSVEMLRFGNSGTEATMMAMRAARAFTGRDIVLKMEGGYHGHHDFAVVSILPEPKTDGLPRVHTEGPGIPVCILDASLVARFNDLDSVESLLRQHRDKIAAIITEPVLNAVGMISPRPGFLKALRELTTDYDVLLIFDEVITFRLGPGGFQAIEGVEPDLTALGKIVGGGFPVGAFGGRREIMERFDPAHPQTIFHSGTFSGHNVTMAAGAATLRDYGEETIDRINRLGERLRAGFNRAFKAVDIKGQVIGVGSLAFVHWRDGDIASPTDAMKGFSSAAELPKLLHLELMNRGVYSAPRGMFNVSTPMTEKEIDQAIRAFEAALEILKPYVVDRTPHLLAG